MYDLAASNHELFVRAIYHGWLLARGAHIDDTVVIGHLRYQLRGLISIAWIEHSATKNSSRHRQVFECHLRWAILANRDPGVRAAQANIGARDCSHANEVIGTREECRKGRGKRDFVAHTHTDRRRHHLLFSNVHLKEAVLEGLVELVSIGRIAYLTIQCDHTRIGCTKCY